MARTSSQKLDFWQFEVGLFNDMKMVDLNEKYGTLGEAVYFRILSYIADTEGYYAVLSDSLVLSIYRSIGSKWLRDKRVILRIIDYCGECGLFDVNLLSQNVITSCGIQRRWLYAKEKARAKGFTTDKFWLLNNQSVAEHTQKNDKCSNNYDKCNINENNCDNNLPYISKVKKSKETPNPLQGGGEKELDEWKDRFFAKYTAFTRKNYKDEDVDYKVLYQEFERSTTLRNMWSFPRVISLYKQIAEGVFRDKQTEQQRAVQASNDRADRERYYSQLREQAQTKADKALAKANADERFNTIVTALKKMEILLAKAEISYPEQLPTLEKAKADLIAKRKAVLAELGIDEQSLVPQYQCKKCSDTGFLPNGKACDCYKG